MPYILWSYQLYYNSFLDGCEAVNCNEGSCENVSETETRCKCNPGWFGEFCDMGMY